MKNAVLTAILTLAVSLIGWLSTTLWTALEDVKTLKGEVALLRQEKDRDDADRDKRITLAMRVSGQNFQAVNALNVKNGLPLLNWPTQ